MYYNIFSFSYFNTYYGILIVSSKSGRGHFLYLLLFRKTLVYSAQSVKSVNSRIYLNNKSQIIFFTCVLMTQTALSDVTS